MDNLATSPEPRWRTLMTSPPRLYRRGEVRRSERGRNLAGAARFKVLAVILLVVAALAVSWIIFTGLHTDTALRACIAATSQKYSHLDADQSCREQRDQNPGMFHRYWTEEP